MLVEPSWSETGKSYAALEILFEEKQSFNPLNGTTLKKNYRAKIQLYQIESDNSVKKTWESDIFDSWILPASLYYHEKTGRIFFLKGLNDEYGTKERLAAILKIGEKKPETIPVVKDRSEEILFAIPAPDGRKIAVGIGKFQEENLQSAKIQLFSIEGMQNEIPKIGFWAEFSPEYLVTWSEDSEILYIKQSKSVRKIILGSKSLENAREFPLCFIGTSFGTDFSKLGYGAEWGEDGKSYKIQAGKQKRIPINQMTSQIEIVSGCR